MPSYDSTARVPFATGGKVGSKKPKVKRIILWKGKAKDWPGAKKAAEQTRNRKADGGAVKVIKTIASPITHLRNWSSSKAFKKANKKRTKKAEGGTAWITKKKKTNPWIQKKKKPATEEAVKANKWITKKEKPKAWITKKKKSWITKKKKQGYDAREDESLGMRTGKESGKKQSFKDRRDESYGAWGRRPNQRINRAKGGKAKDSVDQPGTHSWWLLNRNKRDKKAKGGKADKNWIQGVNKSIKKRGTKGVCTGKKFGSASCPPGSKRYNLAKTFKKMARAKHASGGLVRFI